MALGLAFFTMCIGIGCVLTYSSSLNDDTNLFTSSLYVVFLNIIISVIIGLIVFTFVFEFGAKPSQGVGLAFISLPTLFAKLGFAGNVLAVAFFVALAMTLFRLSKENESIVIFTLGSSPNSIAKFFLAFSAVLSALLLIVAIVMIPIASELNSNFIDYKKTVAKLNLKPTQFGQKFSDWMVYVGSEGSDENGTIYKNIVMFNPFIKDSQRLIVAQNAKMINTKSNIELSLNNGKIYDMRDKVYHQSNFKSMTIRTAQNEKINDVDKDK